MRVYIHGSGRAGRDAWPLASEDDAIFVNFAHISKADDKVAQLAKITPDGATVFAHSAGAVPAALAVGGGHINPCALVLVEPALYDVARGNPEIERHIAEVAEARSLAASGDLFGFWSRMRPLMFGGPADAALWDQERATALKFATVELPWGHGVVNSMVSTVRTLVVTGGWNEEYEAIAAELVSVGATHVQLTGHGHRPQDHDHFEQVVDEFLG